MFDFRAHFYHSAPMESHALGFKLRANTPEGQKQFPISIRSPPFGRSSTLEGGGQGGAGTDTPFT